MTPTISIVMPVYNVEKYLRECLDSVRAQTFKGWECICVDDGSTDASPAILDEYAAKDLRFRVIKREHSNAGACRNVGMGLANGEFLSFLDSDDVFAPRMLEILLSAIEKYGADVAICRAKWFETESGVPVFPTRNPDRFVEPIDNPSSLNDFFNRWTAEPWTKLFRRLFTTKLGLHFQEQHSTNDLFFIRTSLTFATRIVDVRIPLIAYRRHSTSLQATKSKSPLCVFAALRAMERELATQRAFERNPDLRKRLHVWFIADILWHLDGLLDAKAYAECHEATKDFFQARPFSALSESDIGDHTRYLQFDAIRKGCTPLESALLRARLQGQSYRQLRQSLLRSTPYRLGLALVYIPRKIRALGRRIMEKYTHNRKLP